MIESFGGSYLGMSFLFLFCLLPLTVATDPVIVQSPDCEGSACSESNGCPDSQHCLENSCCYCVKEDFTLVLKNLTLAESGIYRCEVDGGRDSLEFTLEVYESGIYPGFNKNLTFDHSECCAAQNMSSKCKPMCKPGELETHLFDPMDCDTEISKFLHCVTEGVPLPDPPESITVNALDTEKLKVCWSPPAETGGSIKFYTVEYKEVPRFPFLGAGGRNSFFGSRGGSAIDSAVEMEDPPSQREPRSHRRRVERYDSLAEEGGTPPEWGADVTLADGSEGTVGIRRKRNTWVFFTHNGVTNETRVKEFKFQKENTTETCHTIENLQPATQYIIYVTASNEHGTSLPSVRTITSTPAVLIKNGTLPNIRQCCIDNGVEDMCVPKLCDLERTPSAFGALDIALNCRAEFSGVAPCLADRRDHTPCCRSKGVTGECLKICDGSATYLGLHSVLCLTMDMNAVYSCIRRGYVTHPSPPTNLTVTGISSEAATVSWDDPLSNPQHVRTVSLFYRREDRPRQGFTRIANVSSPYSLINLEPGVTYMVFLKAHGEDGSSLQSAVEEFDTIDNEPPRACSLGEPLRSIDGGRYMCNRAIPCPSNYQCTSVPGTFGQKECCPTLAAPPTTLAPGVIPNVTECCVRKGMSRQCHSLCSYNTTIDDLLINGAACIQHIGDWVDCGSDGRDHRPCCFQRGVPELCLGFCRPPLRSLNRAHLMCMSHVHSILACGAEGVKKLPGPPKNLRVVSMTKESVKLAWDRAHQPQEPTHYVLRLFSGGEKVREEDITGLSTDVEKLEAGKNYTGHVTARNDHGSSIGSNNVSFTAPGDLTAEADKPVAPHDVKLEWNRLSSVNISWDWTGKSTAGNTLTNVAFTVFYAVLQNGDDGGAGSEWKQLETKDKWKVLDQLVRNRNYGVKVVAVNKDSGDKHSEDSEIVTFATLRAEHPPSVPVILFVPDKPQYQDGEEIRVTCSSTGATKESSVPTVTLTIPTIADPKSGVGMVSENVVANANLADVPIKCEAVNKDGKSSRKLQSLKVVFGATAKVGGSGTVKTLDQLAAVFPCIVRGFPVPEVQWTFSAVRNDKNPKKLTNSLNVTETMHSAKEPNHSYNATLTMRRVFRYDAGYYSCRACNHYGCQTATFQLVVQDLALPKGPKEIEKCCKRENVKEECMSVCDFDLSKLGGNTHLCLNDFPKLLHCARNGIDHSQCCSSNGVPQNCMGLCDMPHTAATSSADLRACSVYSQAVLHCILERQKLIPSMPQKVEVSAYADTVLEVHWKVPEQNGANVQLYVVYYKTVHEKLYKQERTKATWVKLKGLKPNTTYEVTVLAANNQGFSQFSDSQSLTLRSPRKPARTAAGAILGIIFCMLLAAVVILGVVWFTRRRPYRIPAFFTKLRNRHVPNGSESVAFENPGYDREGQIRGLPGDSNGVDGEPVMNGHATENGGKHAWERADLTSPNDSGSPTPLQKGLKYTQMSKT